MKAQMKFQKYLCLVMLILGAITLLYAFLYCTGSLEELGRCINLNNGSSRWRVLDESKYDATFYTDIQGFNTALMYFGIVSILVAVLLYVMGCNSRRNYYVTNYIAIGVCAGANIVLGLVFIVMNTIWRGRFLNVDFTAWQTWYEGRLESNPDTDARPAMDSTLWFDLGYVVYGLLIIASVLLILNLVWKIKLMNGEKKLLNGEAVSGGAAV